MPGSAQKAPYLPACWATAPSRCSVLRGLPAPSHSRHVGGGPGAGGRPQRSLHEQKRPLGSSRSTRSLPPSVASPGQEGHGLGNSPREASPRLTTALSQHKAGETVTKNKVYFLCLRQEREFEASCKASSFSDVNEKGTLTPGALCPESPKQTKC